MDLVHLARGVRACSRTRPRQHAVASLPALLALGVLLVFAPGRVRACIDPPGPPMWTEYVYLHSLTLTSDQDDGLNGETEILIRITTDHDGHRAEFCAVVEGIDMDGPYATSYHVVDGSLASPERKGGRMLVYSHIECDPVYPMNVSIQVTELNGDWTRSLLDVLKQALAKPAGAVQLPGGISLVGPAAEGLSALLDHIARSEQNLGFDSRLIAPGVSDLRAPTTDFNYQMEYTKVAVNDARCEGTTRDAIRELLDGPLLPDSLRGLWMLDWLGYDDEHPFTRNPALCASRMPLLRTALGLIAHGSTEPGTDSTGTAALLDSLRHDLVVIGRQPLVTEIDEGVASGLPGSLLASAQSRLAEGDALALTHEYDAALQAFANGVQLLLGANHPDYVGASELATRLGDGLRLVAVRANPARGSLAFVMQLARDDDVRVDVVDAAGRRVATLVDGPLTAGARAFAWDGRRTDGRAAAAGVYFLRAVGSTGRDLVKFALLR